ncbi:type II toxin-antitoxin system VapC family toxin [Candidatus Thiosymbion oneisti]|uniref:type II toxin-antitoxin system VapC family toxin n=1 Tax=Candidatus Thiosymbion oneisti TaxID=589554 RepID=UPI000AB49FA2|nr:PIN domain-containing protein [Candidatus Thiosymbion oneisti]
MKPIFVDTSALIAIGNRRDTFHSQAIEIKEKLKESQIGYVTTSAILLEFGNAFSRFNLKPTAIQMIEAIKQSTKWTCVNIDDNLIGKGFELFKRMRDKEWGLVDCTSIIVSKDMGISEIFTTDHHFEQAGFEISLKSIDK